MSTGSKNVYSRWVSGNLYFYTSAGNEIFHIDGAGRALVVPAGSTLNAGGTDLEVASVVAAAGSAQGSAAALTGQFNAVTSADGTKGVVLPTGVAGMQIVVVNTSASNILNVYPAGAAAINALSASAAFVLGPGLAGIFGATSTTQWYVDGFAALASTVTELNVLHGVTPGTAAASSAVVLDSAKSLDGGFVIRLGNATTVPSTPLLGLPADVAGAASGTTQNTFYPLSSISIPANALSANGKGFSFQFAGTTATNANAKDFELTYGAATVSLTTGNTGSAQPFLCYGAVYRTGVGAQLVVAEIIIGNAAPIPVVSTSSADETTAWTFSIQSRNTAAAAASATGKFGQVTFQN